MRNRLSVVGVAALLLSSLALSGCASKKCCNKGGAGESHEHAKPATKASYVPFGQAMKLPDNATVPVDRILSEKEKYDGQVVRVSGRVDSVCATKGCWMRVRGETAGETLFVKFTCPVEGRLIPMDAVGKNTIVEGILEVTEISQDEARHYKEDAGAPKAEIDKIVGPQKIVRMKSPAAMVELSSSTGT